MEAVSVNLVFSPAARAELQSWGGAVPPSVQLHSALCPAAQCAQVRDQLEIPGLPPTPQLYVLQRVLQLQPPAGALVLLVGLHHELGATFSLDASRA